MIQNNILLTTIKFKTFQDYFAKIQGFQGHEFGPINYKAFQNFQGPVQTLELPHTKYYTCVFMQVSPSK